MTSDLGKGDFGRPAANKPAEDIERVCVEISAQKCLRLEFIGNVADQHVTDGHHATRMMPDGGSGDDVDQTFTAAIPAYYLEALPECFRVGETRGQSGLTASDDAGTSDGTWMTPRRWVEESRVETQAGDDADPPLHRVKQINRRVAAVGDSDDLPLRPRHEVPRQRSAVLG